MTQPLQPTIDNSLIVHVYSDLDSATQAQHHTLGPGPSQAAPGSHNHDGRTSRKLYNAITVTGSRGGNAAVASLLTALATQGLIIDSTTA